jgi:hypothetical protein
MQTSGWRDMMMLINTFDKFSSVTDDDDDDDDK